MTTASYLAIGGMTCTACSGAITEALEKIPEIESVEVLLITEEAKVIHQSQLPVTTLIKAVEDVGFDASLIRKHPVEKKSGVPPISRSPEPMETSLLIRGMTCASCSASIKEALEKIEGITLASVSLLTEEGLVIHSPSVAASDLKEAIENIGFDTSILSTRPHNKVRLSTGPPESKTSTKLQIEGMTCASCVSTISETLLKTSGVLNADVSLITEEANVLHSSDITSSQLKQIIDECGFEATVLSLEEKLDVQDTTDSILLQIFGISESTDLTHLRYNIEARLNGVPGILDYQIAFQNKGSDPIVTDANSSHVQAIRTEFDNQDDADNFIDELFVSFDSLLIGIRDIVESLDNLDDTEVRFLPINTVDQSTSTQLRMLSRTKDIKYWRSICIKSFVVGFPVVVLSQIQSFPFWRRTMIFKGLYLVSLIEFILTYYVQFHLGSTFFKKFGLFIRNKGRNATMDVLVCISTSISFTFSILSIILSVWNGQEDKPPKVLFETTCMLVFFISIGKWLENKAKGATTSALSRLVSLAPTNCNIVEDMAEFERRLKEINLDNESIATSSSSNSNTIFSELQTKNVTIDLIQTGDIAVVAPGGKIPADGVIRLGRLEVDESFLTGESLPIFKQVGDTVIGGSVNGVGVIYVEVLKTGKNSQLQQIIDLVKNSQVKKAPVQRFADYIAARFVPAVLILALTTFFVWLMIAAFVPNDKLPRIFKNEENGKFFVCLQLGISVIVVACPCALGLAAPTAVMVGTGIGASHGVLIKGGEVLENISKVNIIMFDKTGTLTSGDMTVLHSENTNKSISNEDWFTLVGSLESNSEHPVGKCVVKTARKNLGMNFEEDTFATTITDLEVTPGMGISGKVSIGKNKLYDVTIGNEKMLNARFPLMLEEQKGKNSEEYLNDTTVHVVIDSVYSGVIICTDQVKPGAAQVLNFLQYSQNYIVGMITGDNRQIALKVGKQLGIPKGNIFAEVSPVDKDAVIVKIKERYGPNASVAFVGDGVNDAPALAQADVGMAVSSGSDIAIESADVVLLGGGGVSLCDLFGVAIALGVSTVTFQRIKLNFMWATMYNIMMLPFAMGVFLVFNLMLPPVAAAACMALSSVSVVISSLLLKKWKIPNISDGEPEEENIGIHFDLLNSSRDSFEAQRRNASFSQRFSIRKKNKYRLLLQ